MDKLLALLAPIVRVILSNVTPSIKGEAQKWVRDFASKAKATPSPWDDLLADFLVSILDA